VGVSRRLVFSDVEHAVAITDFVQTTSLHPKISKEASLQAVVDTLKKLHSAPLFPESIDYLDVVNVLMGRCRAAEILPNQVLKRIRGFFGKIALVYPRMNIDVVSSHNDLHPGNLLFQGERAWMVDWEAAFAADCFVDLAAIANFFLENESEREWLLRNYFGAGFLETHRARLFLMRQVNRLFYAFTALNFVAIARPDVRLTEMHIREMKFDLCRGMDTVSGNEDRLCLACMLLKDALHDLDSPRFTATVATLFPAGLNCGA
jgi:thiamine kinase-like enzyme